MRRNLLFFVTGALLALAAVLLVRSADDGTATPPAQTATTPAQQEAARRVRSVRLARQHRAHRTRHTTSTTPAATGADRPGTTAGAAVPRAPARGAPTKTATVPQDDEPPASTEPDDPTATDPGTDAPGGDTTGDGDGTTTPGDSGNPGVTIPNPATPDASVGP